MSLYSESHALSFAKLSLSSDPNVRSALDFKVQLSSSSSNASKVLCTRQSNALVPPILFSTCVCCPFHQTLQYIKIFEKKLADDFHELYK